MQISKKTLYSVFLSKETILQETLWHETKEIINVLNKTLPSGSQADTVLFSLCYFIFSDRIERDEDGYFGGIYSGDSFIKNAALDSLKRVVHTVYNDGVNHGLFKPIHPVLASAVIVSFITTALNSYHSSTNPYSMFNEALGMIADSVSYKYRLPFVGFKNDYYSILGVSRNASPDEIKKAYRKKALKYHPDKTNGQKDLDNKFLESKKSYEILTDPEKRSAYDQYLSIPFSGESDDFTWDEIPPP